MPATPPDVSGSVEPPPGDPRARVAAEIAERWNGAGVRYAVVHGLEGFPRRVGRDLDVLVHRADVERALALARERLEARGWVVARPPGLWGERLVAFAGGAGGDSLEVHTLTRLVWASVVLAGAPHAAEGHAPFRVDPWAAFAKRILMPLLAGDRTRFVERPAELRLSTEEGAVAGARLARLCGRERAERLVRLVRAGDAAGLARAADDLQRVLLATSLVRAPLPAAAALSRKLATRVREHLSPCAPVVALVGGTPAARAAVLGALREHPPAPFLAVRVRRWAGGDARTAGMQRWLGVARVAAWRLGTHWWRDTVAQSHQQLVVYDGGSLAPAGHGPGEASLVGLLLPKLDLVVRLAPADAGAAGEGARALEGWRRLTAGGRAAATAPGDDPARAAREVGRLAARLFIRDHGWASRAVPDEAPAPQVAKTSGSL